MCFAPLSVLVVDLFKALFSEKIITKNMSVTDDNHDQVKENNVSMKQFVICDKFCRREKNIKT